MKGRWTLYPEHLAEAGFTMESENLQRSIWLVPEKNRIMALATKG